MRNLTSGERQELTAAAHKLRSLAQIGQNGISDSVVAQVEQLISAHELVKVKFNEFKEEKAQLAAQIAERTNSVLVRVIGNVAIFYRPAKDPDKRKYGIA